MTAGWSNGSEPRTRAHAGAWPDENGPDELERYRAWIAAKLFQGIALLVLLTIAVVLFDSL